MANDNGAPGDFSGVTYLGDPNEQGSNSYHIKRASGKVLGPFDAELIIQMIEGSKLSGDEGVSVDRESWVPIMAVSRFAEAFRQQGGSNATLYGVQRVGQPDDLSGDEPTLMSDRSSLGLDGDAGLGAFPGFDSGAPPVPQSLAGSGLGVTEDSGMNLASGNWASLDEGVELSAQDALSAVAGLRRVGSEDESNVGESVRHSTTELPTPRGFTNFPGQNDGLPSFPSPDELAASLDFASAPQPSVSASDAPEPSRAFESPPAENPRTMAFSMSDLPADRGSSDLPVSSGISELPVSSSSDLPISAGADLPISAGTNLPRSAEADLPISAGSELPVFAGSDLPVSMGSVELPATAGTPHAAGTEAMSSFSASAPPPPHATIAMGDSGSTLTPPNEPGDSVFGTMAMSGLSDAELPASIASFDPLAVDSEQTAAELPTSSRSIGSSLLDDVADADDLWAAPDTMVSPSDMPDSGRSFGARPAPSAPSFQTDEIGFDISGAAPSADSGSDFDEFFPADDGAASRAMSPTPLDQPATEGTVQPAKKSTGKGGGGAVKLIGGLAAIGLIAGLGYMVLSNRPSADESVSPETTEVVPERVARVVELDGIDVLQPDEFAAILLFIGDARTALEQGGGAEDRAKLVLAAALMRIEHPNAGNGVGDLNSEVALLRAEESPSDLISLAIGAWEASQGDSAATASLSGLRRGELGAWANLFAGLLHVQQYRGVFPVIEQAEPVAEQQAPVGDGEGSGSGDGAAPAVAVAEEPPVAEQPQFERPTTLSSDAARAFAASRDAADGLVAARYWSGIAALEGRDGDAASGFFAEALALNEGHVPSQVGQARTLLSQARLGDADARIQEVIDRMGDDTSAESRSEAYLVAAEISIARLQPQVAIESLLSALEADSANAVALESLGVQFARAGQYGRAVDYFSGNPDLPEGHPAVSLGLGRAQLGAELLDEAKATLEAGADANPRDTRFSVLLGQVYEARAEFDLARQYYRQALQVDPNMAVATVALGRLLERENRLGEALALLEEASLQSGDDAATANSIGEMFLRMGQPNRAVDAFQVALERDNSFPDARINLTEYYLNTGQQTRAIEYIDQMVAAGIDSPRVRFLNARALHGQERYEQGISLMLELLEDEPENTVYLMHLGQLQFDAGNFEQSRARFGRAADLQPSLLEATYMMGRSDMELSDMDSAIAALTTVAQRSSDGKFHFWLGRALDGARQQVPALDAYTRAIDDDVSWSLQNPTVYHERGKLFFQRGRTTAAYWDLRTALTLDPRRADTHWLLGQVFYEQRDYDTAITSYNRALALDPGRSSIEYQIGVCHLRAEPQRLPEAIAALERAREGGYGSVRADLFQRLAYAYRDLGQNGEAADNLERFLENATIPYDETLETQNEVRRLRGAR